MTGWNLPPGCSVRDLPGASDPPCYVCGGDPADCPCPECPTCGSAGDPECYVHLGKGAQHHGLYCDQVQALMRASVWTGPDLAEDAECPACGGVLLRSQVDPADRYWYCTEDDCVWTGSVAS